MSSLKNATSFAVNALMAQTGNNAPSWLFAFVDLAFLMVIAMTQVAKNADSSALHVAEMLVPRIEREVTSALPPTGAAGWQLRVHPPTENEASPFELLRLGAAPSQMEATRLPLEMLAERLQQLERAQEAKPLLAPHADSRSQDMLDAIALVEERWPGPRRAAVLRSKGHL